VPEAKAAIAQGGTENLAAYDLYTRGLQQSAHYNFDSLTQAERLFQQALTADPKYVDAMRAQLWNWDRMQITGMITQAELVARATPWLDRIEAQDPGNGALIGFRARFAASRGERDEARQLYQRAVAGAPNDTALGSSYVQFLRAQDEQPAALEQLDRVLRLDAANSTLHVTRSRILKNLERYEEATAAAKRATELDPSAAQRLRCASRDRGRDRRSRGPGDLAHEGTQGRPQGSRDTDEHRRDHEQARRARRRRRMDRRGPAHRTRAHLRGIEQRRHGAAPG
jgi:tetratricopeptide (TPR) repeat protein